MAVCDSFTAEGREVCIICSYAWRQRVDTVVRGLGLC
jgi:hypothetical protein